MHKVCIFTKDSLFLDKTILGVQTWCRICTDFAHFVQTWCRLWRQKCASGTLCTLNQSGMHTLHTLFLVCKVCTLFKPSQANLAKHLAIQHLGTRRAYQSRPGRVPARSPPPPPCWPWGCCRQTMLGCWSSSPWSWRPSSSSPRWRLWRWCGAGQWSSGCSPSAPWSAASRCEGCRPSAARHTSSLASYYMWQTHYIRTHSSFTDTLNANSRIDLHWIWGDYAHRLQTVHPYQISSSCFQLSSCTIGSPSPWFNSGPTIGPGPAAVGNLQDSCRTLLATLPLQQCLTNGSLVYHSVFESLISIFLKLFLLDSEKIPMVM